VVNLRSIIAIAGPSIGVFLLATLSTLLIIRVVADLGADAVAAVTAGQRVLFLFLAILMGINAGSTALVSRSWGAGDRALAGCFARISLLASIIIVAFVAVLVIAGASLIADYFQLQNTAREQAIVYIRWVSFFAITQAVVIVLGTVLRSVGDAMTPLYFSGAANFGSVLAAWGLASGFFGIPGLGVRGAAIGWGLAYLLCAVLYLWQWRRGALRLPWTKDPPMTLARFRIFARVCWPAVTEQLVMQFAMLGFAWFVGLQGKYAFAAYGIGLAILSVAAVIALGFSIAAAATVGQSMGEGSQQRAELAARTALQAGLVLMIMVSVFLFIAAKSVAGLMVKDPRVLALTVQFVQVLAFLLPLLTVDLILAGAMRGAGDTRFPMLVGVGVAVFVRLPLAYIVTLLGSPAISLFGIFLADQAVKTLLLYWRFRSRRWLRKLPVRALADN